MTEPSYADALHQLAQGYELPGDELLPLIGRAAIGIQSPRCYSLADVPELLERAGDLAQAVDPEGEHGLFAVTIAQYIDSQTGRLPAPVRESLWMLGFAADMHRDFYHQYRPEHRCADFDAPAPFARN